MQTKTALAVAGSVLAVPGTALAAATDDDRSTDRGALHPSGRLTHNPVFKDHLVRTNVRLARREARLSDDRLRKGYTRRVRDDAVSVIRDRNQRLRKRITRLERRAGSTASAPLQAIAACESGGDPSTNTGNGFYGKYQFTTSTWAERRRHGQSRRRLRGRAGPPRRDALRADRRSPWPVCGR